MKTAKRILISVLSIYLLLCALVMAFQRSLLYFPSHDDPRATAAHYGLQAWTLHGEAIGFCHEAPNARRIWLMLHGNGGQAADRGQVWSECLGANDSLFILEYPGYGVRPGSPSKAAFNEAAVAAYESLRQSHPGVEIDVLGESLGSGAGCHLATLPDPPHRIVLAVPFDRLVDVAQEKFPLLPIHLMMFDRWDNIAALQGYRGRVDIYGAVRDAVIPIAHARKLAASVPGVVFHEIDCGHNGWADRRLVDLRE